MWKIFPVLVTVLLFVACEQLAGPAVEPPAAFVRVTGIKGAPLGGKKGAVLNLGAARVAPEDATAQDIVWVLLDCGSTGITEDDLAGGKPIPPAAGTLKLRAVVAGGLGEGRDYAQDITIAVIEDIFDEDFVAVSGIEGVPLGGLKGAALDLGAARVMPEDATLQRIEWILLDGGSTGVTENDLAEGKPVPAVAGTLRLLAAVADGLGEGLPYAQEIIITIADAIEAVPYSIIIGSLNKGSVTANPASAAEGTEITLTVSPDAGYALKAGTVKVNGGAVTASGSGAVYAFVMPAGNVTVSAEFEALPEGVYTVGIGKVHNGTINADPASAPAGALVALTASPDAGYALKAGTVKVNNGAVAASGSGAAYSFVMPAGNVTVSAEFEELVYDVTIALMAGGSVVANPTSATAGTPVTLTASPDTGYTLKASSVRVNGGAVAVSSSGAAYSFVMPTGDAVVSAEFEAALLYSVTIDYMAYGSVAANPASAAAGATVILTATPYTGYALKAGSLHVNSGAVNVGGSGVVYAFVMPAGNATVSAEFEAINEPTPERILVGLATGSLPDTLIYMPGEEFNPAGLVVHGVYNDGSREELGATEYAIDTSKINGTGYQRVFIRKDNLAPVAILVYIDETGRVLKSAVLATPPSSSQEMGKDFNKTGMVITGTYADGTTEQLNVNLCTVTGYDKYTRGTQSVTLKINGIAIAADMAITVKLPASATLDVPERNTTGKVTSLNSYLPGYSGSYLPVYIRGMAFDLERAKLKPRVKVNGANITTLSWGNGLGPGDTVTGYNAYATGRQTLSLNVDGVTGSFDVFVLDAEPHAYFDYGYMRHAGDPGGAGPGAGKYYAQPNETLILAPIRFLIGYDEESRDIGAAYSWSVAGGSYDTAAGTTGETFAFTPKAAGTYTVTVSVTGRNFVTGQSDTKTASTEVVCYAGTLPSGTFVSPLKNFSPGQFTEKGTGYGWSLGAALGYEVFRISPSNTFIVTGNAFGGWEEPGIAWAQEDRNGNGLPDEMWYELTGSDETNPLTKPYITRRYAIKWFRFGDEAEENENGQIIRSNCWVDSKGRAGVMGGGWPKDWGVPGDWVLYAGTLLRDGQGSAVIPGVEFPRGLAGYVDCFNNNEQQYRFSKDVAIRADGSPANLGNIHFVKVQTGEFAYGGAVGETSTEIVTATGLGDQSGGFQNPLGSANNR